MPVRERQTGRERETESERAPGQESLRACRLVVGIFFGSKFAAAAVALVLLLLLLLLLRLLCIEGETQRERERAAQASDAVCEGGCMVRGRAGECKVVAFVGCILFEI